MKINRIAEEKVAPEWIFDNGQATEYIDKKTLKADEAESILKLSSTISEDDLVTEKDRIEKCAASKTPYYYNSQWSAAVKAELKEYASMCKMDMGKFKAIDPSELTVHASAAKMIKTASTLTETPKLVLNDPFKIDEKLAGTYEKSKWHAEAQLASKLVDKPTMSGIVPVRGGENYYANSESKLAKGQNSITAPDAIEKLINSSEEDTGARLKRENEAKEASRKTKHEEWQKEKIEAMVGKDILPNRYVFPTESLNAQPGIRGEVFDYSKMPEKTAGEQLKAASEERRKQIKGEDRAKHEFTTSKNSVRAISEDFSEELKKHLGQMD
jgi:hypothetical protein